MKKLIITIICILIVVIFIFPTISWRFTALMGEKAMFNGLNNAILRTLNGKSSYLADIGSKPGTYTRGLMSGSFSTDSNGRPTIDPGSSVVYDFNDGKIKVYGKAGRNNKLASVDEVLLAMGAEVEFKNGKRYIHNGEKWVLNTSEEAPPKIEIEKQKEILEEEKKVKEVIQEKSCEKDCQELYNNGELREDVTAEECIQTAC